MVCFVCQVVCSKYPQGSGITSKDARQVSGHRRSSSHHPGTCESPPPYPPACRSRRESFAQLWFPSAGDQALLSYAIQSLFAKFLNVIRAKFRFKVFHNRVHCFLRLVNCRLDFGTGFFFRPKVPRRALAARVLATLPISENDA